MNLKRISSFRSIVSDAGDIVVASVAKLFPMLWGFKIARKLIQYSFFRKNATDEKSLILWV